MTYSITNDDSKLSSESHKESLPSQKDAKNAKISLESFAENTSHQYDFIRDQIDKNISDILIEGYLSFTKGDKVDRTKLVLHRLFDIEESSRKYLPDLSTLLSRLVEIDKSFDFYCYPNHYAVGITESENFPNTNVFIALNGGSDQPSAQMGFEFIEQWLCINNQVVVPFCKTVFDEESQKLIFSTLSPDLIGTVIFCTALLHEWGHMVTPYKVLPVMSHFKKLSSLLQGMLGETSANCVAAIIVPERPEIALWLLLFHLAYTGRKGFRDAPAEGWLNHDNDTLSAVLFYQRAIRDGVLKHNHNGLLHLNMQALPSFYSDLLEDLNWIADEAFPLPDDGHCNCVIRQWLATQIWFNEDSDRFMFSHDLRNLYCRVIDLSEQPIFKPVMGYD